MKVGDLVRLKETGIAGLSQRRVGVLVDIIPKKVWRTQVRGTRINWDIIEPEPHGVVLYSHNNGTINIPVEDLEAV
jgi:hypothetical protein